MGVMRKIYRIESEIVATPPERPDPLPVSLAPSRETAGGTQGDQHARLLAEIAELKDMLRPAQGVVGNLADAYRREVMDLVKLRVEFDAIQQAIQDTKRQIASIHASAPRQVGMQNVAMELGAVVTDTEQATNVILATAERVEMLAGVIQSETTRDAMISRAAEIAHVMGGLYEACNFQDLTGQRISRVVDALGFIETRVARMVDIWGGLDAIKTVMESELAALEDERDTEGVHALVNGPALVGEVDDVVSQDDIDALFA
jgi:chemotaxis protein CheZ